MVSSDYFTKFAGIMTGLSVLTSHLTGLCCRYYDGLVWASLFVPWRTFSESDSVVKCSAYGAPGADIRPSCLIPFWWAIFPPTQDTLRGLLAMGYHDAHDYFRRKHDSDAKIIAFMHAHARTTPRPSRFDEESRKYVSVLHAHVQQTWRRVIVLGILSLLMLVYFSWDIYHYLSALSTAVATAAAAAGSAPSAASLTAASVHRSATAAAACLRQCSARESMPGKESEESMTFQDSISSFLATMNLFQWEDNVENVGTDDG